MCSIDGSDMFSPVFRLLRYVLQKSLERRRFNFILFQRLIRNVELDSNTPPYIKLDLKCNTGSDCYVGHNQTLKITGTLTVKECPEKINQKYLIKIGPKSLSEKFAINLEIDCECDCEKNTPSNSFNSTKCNSAGTYQCGICKCNENR